MLFVDCRLLTLSVVDFVWCVLFVICYVVFVVGVCCRCFLLFVVCCLLFVVSRSLLPFVTDPFFLFLLFVV